MTNRSTQWAWPSVSSCVVLAVTALRLLRPTACAAMFFSGACTHTILAQQPSWQERSTGTQASLRALAVGEHSISHRPVLWAAGAKGTILVSTDVGERWQMVGPANYPELEFRSLHAWSESHAIVASAGTPAIVLKTDDAGKTWREVHRDPHPQAFFDGLKFIDEKRGVLFGDPIDSRFAVLTSTDSGETWQAVPRDSLPAALHGEAAFAASNSAMIASKPASIWIGTGGSVAAQSRVLVSHDFGQSWQVTMCPLASAASCGIFSLAIGEDARTLVAVGGDYQPGAHSATTAARSRDGGVKFSLASAPPSSFRSSVVYSRATFWATGPTGTDYSLDGDRWVKLSDIGFHVMATLPDGQLVAVGANGRFGICRP